MEIVDNVYKEKLLVLVAEKIAGIISNAKTGSLFRINGCSNIEATWFVDNVTLDSELGFEVKVLSENDFTHPFVSSDGAVEIRNDLTKSFLLYVPSEVRNVHSSLDNPFNQVSYSTLVGEVVHDLMSKLLECDESEIFAYIVHSIQAAPNELVAEFLIELLELKDLDNVGRSLWKIGLIPDLGDNVVARISVNVEAVKAIASKLIPSRPIDARLVVANVREGEKRYELLDFFTTVNGLQNSYLWGERLASSEYKHLTFDKWDLTSSGAQEIESLNIIPFINPTGTFDRHCKLLQYKSDGGEILDGLYCKISAEVSPKVKIKWNVKPKKIFELHHWLVEVLPPSDMRDRESSVIASRNVSADKSTADITIDYDSEILDGNRVFVVRLRPISINGSVLCDVLGRPVEANSQEFDVLTDSTLRNPDQRKANSRSIADARLRVALAGETSPEVGTATYDDSNQIVSVSLSGAHSAQILQPRVLLECQGKLLEASQPSFIKADIRAGEFLSVSDLNCIELDGITGVYKERRVALFSKLSQRLNLKFPDLLVWDDELNSLANSYVHSFLQLLNRADTETELRNKILLIDTIQLNIESSVGHNTNAIILPPLHPLRMIWFKDYYKKVDEWIALIGKSGTITRKPTLDLDLVTQIAPNNYPFFVRTDKGDLLTYFDEFTFGAGLYLAEDLSNPDSVVEAIYQSFGINRQGHELFQSKKVVNEKISAYRKSHESHGGFRLLSLNPGDGLLLTDSVRELLVAEDNLDERLSDNRVSLSLMSDNFSFASPVKGVHELSKEIRSYTSKLMQNPLAPQLEVSITNCEKVFTDNLGFHVAVMQNVANGKIEGSDSQFNRTPALDGLLTPLVVKKVDGSGELLLEISPATATLASEENDILGGFHDKFLSAIGKSTYGDMRKPVIRVNVHQELSGIINRVHETSDWVITVDKRAGSSIYSDPSSSILEKPYLIDYSPDFVSGIGTQISVTTTHRNEVEQLLARGMSDLLLEDNYEGVNNLLNSLAAVSGQLALRLIHNNSLATEAVSLGALIMYLKQNGKLQNKILIPLDAHKNIFSQQFKESESAKRCDLLLVTVRKNDYLIEAIEVKARTRAYAPDSLLDQVKDQLDNTVDTLNKMIFDLENQRIDAELQWVRFANLLHFYADKSLSNGLIQSDNIDSIHRFIDKHTTSRLVPTVEKRGYVISMNDEQQSTLVWKGIKIEALGRNDLASFGITTKLDFDDQDDNFLKSIGVEEKSSKRKTSSFVPGIVAEDEVTSIQLESDEKEHLGQEVDASNIDSDFESEHSGANDGDSRENQLISNQLGEGGDERPISVLLGTDNLNQEIRWNVSTKGSPHAFIVGIPGQGKSVTTRNIISEFQSVGVPSLIFDFHGDMASNPPIGARVLDASTGLPFNPFEVPEGSNVLAAQSAFEIAEILELTFKLGDIQRDRVYNAIRNCYLAQGWESRKRGQFLPSISDFVDEIEKIEANDRNRNVVARLRPFTDFGLFSENAEESFSPLAQNGLVIDLSSVRPEESQLTAVSFLLRRVYNEMFSWPQDEKMKLLLALDEAHRFPKDLTLAKLMKEGRKYGVSVVIASQSVDDFPDQVVQNAGMKIAFRTNAPASKKVSQMLSADRELDLMNKIEKLGVGQAFVSTPEITRPSKVNMKK